MCDTLLAKGRLESYQNNLCSMTDETNPVAPATAPETPATPAAPAAPEAPVVNPAA